MTKCLVCGKGEAKAPRKDEKYCEVCWEKRIDALQEEQENFRARRFTRTKSTEAYFLFRRGIKRACGQIIIIKEELVFHIVCVLYPILDWQQICYEDSIEKMSLSDIVPDVVEDLVEQWGGGKWYLELYYSKEEDPDVWEGEI